MIKQLVGKRIKALRTEKNISQEQLALLSGLDRTYITYIETAKKNVTIETLYKITKSLGVSLSEFFNFDENSICIKNKVKPTLTMKDLVKNKLYTNIELSTIFSCSTQGGMRVSVKNKTVTLINQKNSVVSPYSDSEIKKDGSFIYTGMGLKGDQVVKETNQNGKVAFSKTNGYRLFYFIAEEKNQYRFIGEVALSKAHYFVDELDAEGEIRKVVKFPLIVIC